jgi:hypothetical protein
VLLFQPTLRQYSYSGPSFFLGLIEIYDSSGIDDNQEEALDGFFMYKHEFYVYHSSMSSSFAINSNVDRSNSLAKT